jgi:hypothetical protein
MTNPEESDAVDAKVSYKRLYEEMRWQYEELREIHEAESSSITCKCDQLSEALGKLKAEKAGLEMIVSQLSGMLHSIQFVIEMRDKDEHTEKVKEITDKFAYLSVWLETYAKI